MSSREVFVLPAPEAIRNASAKIRSSLPQHGLPLDQVSKHLKDDITPGLHRGGQIGRYYGYIYSGATPASQLADRIVSEYDQNLVLHAPEETVATEIDQKALHMACDLFGFKAVEWGHKILTTGTTAGNIIGIACGRQFILEEVCARKGIDLNPTHAGLIKVLRACDIDSVQILAAAPHSTTRKAASILGFGHDSVEDLSRSSTTSRFDLTALEAALKRPNTVSIVSVSCSEVNAGLFTTTGEEMKVLRRLCDEHGAWLHVDAAFGLLARALPDTDEFANIKSGVAGMELADSIATDAHKLLNVNHECGIFLSKHPDIGLRVFENLNASYLVINRDNSDGRPLMQIPSPCNMGLENSRRLRGLPLYASLLSLGASGHQEMMMRMIRLARAIAQFMLASPHFELLPTFDEHESENVRLARVYMVVLFRAKDPTVNAVLVQKVNRRRRIFISGSKFEGRPAARFAVASWQTDVVRDFALIQSELTAVSHEPSE